MRYLNGILVGILVIVGVCIGFVSLYFASLTGVMSRLGFVGGDITREVRVNELVRGVRDIPGRTTCDAWQAILPVPTYLFDSRQARIPLGFTLGYERVVCGVGYTISGNTERGVYTMLKGLYYVRSSYLDLGNYAARDSSLCLTRQADLVDPWVGAYLAASHGKVHDVIANVYQEIQEERAHVAELCDRVMQKNSVDEAPLTF